MSLPFRLIPVQEASYRTLGRYLIFQITCDTKNFRIDRYLIFISALRRSSLSYMYTNDQEKEEKKKQQEKNNPVLSWEGYRSRLLVRANSSSLACVVRIKGRK